MANCELHRNKADIPSSDYDRPVVWRKSMYEFCQFSVGCCDKIPAYIVSTFEFFSYAEPENCMQTQANTSKIRIANHKVYLQLVPPQ
jgi:hypothetical protein